MRHVHPQATKVTNVKACAACQEIAALPPLCGQLFVLSVRGVTREAVTQEMSMVYAHEFISISLQNQSVSCLWCNSSACPFAAISSCASSRGGAGGAGDGGGNSLSSSNEDYPGAGGYEAGYGVNASWGGWGGESFDEVMRALGTHAMQFAWAPDDDFGQCFSGTNALFRYTSTLVGVLLSPSEALRQRVSQVAPLVFPTP